MSISERKIQAIENQIEEEKKTVDYDTREFTIEIIVKKYLEEIETDQNEIFVPDYQREFVWDEERQSKLIESIVLGLPIPIIFVAENSNGRLEIVDGSQRIRTLAAFISNDLCLSGLTKLKELNGIKFSNLPVSRQRKIKNAPLRMIVLSDSATDMVKNDLFERINRGSDLLRNMEKRKGIYRGEFNDFIYNECAKNKLLSKNAPLAKTVVNRQEHEELILRFFALIDSYPYFKTNKRGIGVALDEYMDNANKSFSTEIKQQKKELFERMLKFVNSNFINGFSKRQGQGVSRIFFEAISVGVHLALESNPGLAVKQQNVRKWLSDPHFSSLISGKYKTHTPSKIKERVEYVRDKLLNQG